MDFKLKDGEQVRTTICDKASATVIEAGDLVSLTAGLIVKATAASTRIAYCPEGAPAGTDKIEVMAGNDFTLVGTADANFAVTDKGILCDIVDDAGTLKIDLGTSSTNVLKVGVSETAGTVGSPNEVEVRINAPLY